MTKLKGILLTQGMHGMISQVEGLAKALELDFTHHTVELNNFWKFFPPKLTPISQKVFEKINTSNFDVIISCGRKSVIPSIYLKKNSDRKVINIHIQDPKVSLHNFNFVVAPEHDGLSGDNVLQTKGAIHYLTKKEITSHTNYLKSRLEFSAVRLKHAIRFHNSRQEKAELRFQQRILNEHLKQINQMLGKNEILRKWSFEKEHGVSCFDLDSYD